MDVNVYLRVGKGRNGYKAAAASTSNPRALSETRNGAEHAIPTIEIKLALELPDDAFRAATQHLEVKLNELGMSVEVSKP